MAGKRNAVLAGSAAAAGILATAVLATDHWDVTSTTEAFEARGFVRRQVMTPAGQMSYFEAGAGEPLVFLHGIGGGASAWTWIFVAPEFASGHRVIVPDWVGWGQSEHPDRYLEFGDYVASLEALLSAVGGPATVVAQSLACGFAAAVAQKRPDLIKNLILHTPSGGRDFGADAFGPFARATLTTIASIPGVNRLFYKALFHRSQFIGGWLRQEGFSDPGRVTREIINAFLFSARRRNAGYSAIPFATGELRFDIAPHLQALRTPTLMFWGAEETQVGVDVGRRLHALRPDIPLSLIADTKACPELERPREVVAVISAALAEFEKSTTPHLS